ncbi:MAG: isochorismate synthase, partial [Actinobacteria bacterium]|nr:isochorismate synthase [Actinomycetota bacterium]
LGPAFDLIATYRPGGFFFERSGVGVSSAGIATRVGADGGPNRIERLATLVGAALREVRMEGEGPAPVAVGAIPFDEGWAAELVIPSRTVRRDTPGETWQLDVGPDGPAPPDADRERWSGRTAPHDAFEEIQLRPDPEPDDYAAAVLEATGRIRDGRLRKVVLARSIMVDAGRGLDAKQLLWRLRAVDPDCYAFAVSELELERDHVARTRSLVGASPELLVAKRGDEVRATPLAGSAPRFGDPGEDRASAEGLLASAKDREEHAVVVDAVADALRAVCNEVSHPSEPEHLGTANVWHLSTPFHGRLRADVRSVLDVVASLHPTPAVCGAPREAAREALGELESIDRGLYGGPVGWVDAKGDGDWAIALRCAEIAGTTARLFAGAGIVAGSVPDQELDETERKFRALLDSLRWG